MKLSDKLQAMHDSGDVGLYVEDLIPLASLLESERDALAALVETLRQADRDYKDNNILRYEFANKVMAAINSTPQQCLAEIKAEAVEDALAETYDEIRYRIGKDFANNIETIISDYVAKVRQGGEIW